MTTQTMSAQQVPSLRRTLKANAVFSGVSALVLTGFSSPLADAFDVPRWVLVSIGVGLVVWAVMTWRVASNPARNVVMSVVVGDFAWVVGAAAVIAIPGTMTATGKAALAAATLVVLVFGVLQLRSVRTLGR